jgi:preprotein translocase subunit SecG
VEIQLILTVICVVLLAVITVLLLVGKKKSDCGETMTSSGAA